MMGKSLLMTSCVQLAAFRQMKVNGSAFMSGPVRPLSADGHQLDLTISLDDMIEGRVRCAKCGGSDPQPGVL